MTNKTNTKVAVKAKTISRTKATDMIHATKGRFFTVTYMKKNGTMRTMNGNRKGVTKLGYIIMNVIKEGPKNFDPRTMTAIKVAGQVYNIK